MINKLLIKLIWLIVILLASFLFVSQGASAKTLKDCKVSDLTDYFSLEKDSSGDYKGTAAKDLDDAIEEAKENDTSVNLEVRLAFEKARTKYHDTVKCVFDHATIAILGSACNVGSDINMANLPNLIDMLPDLLKPDLACLDEKKIADMLKDNSPSNILQPLLDAYQKYAEFLKHLLQETGTSPDIDSATVGSFETLFGRYEGFKLIVENEMQDAIVALDTAFIALKEMRMAFVMHVHFQCMLKNLEMYRRVMANLRSVVTVLPPLIEDASMHK